MFNLDGPLRSSLSATFREGGINDVKNEEILFLVTCFDLSSQMLPEDQINSKAKEVAERVLKFYQYNGNNVLIDRFCEAKRELNESDFMIANQIFIEMRKKEQLSDRKQDLSSAQPSIS